MHHVSTQEEVRSLIAKGVDPATVYCTEEAARAVLPYTVTTLRKARCLGALANREAPPYRKFGRWVRYRLDDLLAWMEEVERDTFLTTADHAAREHRPAAR